VISERLSRGNEVFSRSVSILLFSALCLAASPRVNADVYNWVDERGVVNYGDKPPQSVKGARPLASEAGSLSVVPGIPREELERLRERDVQRRLRRLELEIDELRAREAGRAAAVAELPEPEFYDSGVYGYPVYGGFRRKWHRHPGFGWIHRPQPPMAKPWRSGPAQLQSGLAPLPSGLAPPPSGLEPLQWSAPRIHWKR
jgi:hypothetical protein